MRGCVIAAGIFCALVALLGFAIYQGLIAVKDSFDDFPPYAKQEFVLEYHQSLLQDVEQSIKQSDSFYSLLAQLENVQSPELIQIQISKQPKENQFFGETINLFEEPDEQSFGYTLINATGYGSIGDKPVIVIRVVVNKHKVESLLLIVDEQNLKQAFEKQSL